MKLLDYVKTRATQRELAAKLGITPVLINQWANGKRPIPPERCVEIERATNGEVTRPELRPDDWERIWPELALGHHLISLAQQFGRAEQQGLIPESVAGCCTDEHST